MPTLVVAIADSEPYEVEVDREFFTVGRSGKSTIKISAPGVSKVHVRFTRTADGYVAEDADSKNGIAVNGTRTDRSPIIAGDEIQLGASVVLHWEFIRRKKGEDVDSSVPLDPGEMWPAARRAKAKGRKIKLDDADSADG